jgi:RNA polymerase sigma factor (sigma-70 family)
MFFRKSPKKAVKADDELLLLYKETGDMLYLGELYERYMHLVFGVCMKYFRNEEESKDMTMQIFEKLAVECRKGEVKNFSGWLHVLARNECLMQLRSAKYKHEKGAQDLNEEIIMEREPLVHHTEEEDLEASLQEIERGVETLPPEQKEAITLFYIQQKSYKEIAELTGWELTKVKSYIQNGKRNLKTHLQKLNEQS